MSFNTLLVEMTFTVHEVVFLNLHLLK